MAYRIKADEPVEQSIKRVVAEELTSAIGQLSKTDNREKSIHEARKSIKKVRGALRLVEKALGDTYRAENAQLRDVGRSLSEFRDQVAMIEVFDEMAKWRTRQKRLSKKDPDEFASIRRRLEAQKSAQEKSANIVKLADQAKQALSAAGERLQANELAGDALKAVAAGLNKRYRRGRKAMKAAVKHPETDRYHAWRKAVKDQWYHIRLLGEVSAKPIESREQKLKELETCLGDDHNLAVLTEKLQEHPAEFGKAESVKAFLKQVGEFQQDLRKRAGILGRNLYKQRPRVFAKRMTKNWRSEWTDRKPEPEVEQAVKQPPRRAERSQARELATA